MLGASLGPLSAIQRNTIHGRSPRDAAFNYLLAELYSYLAL